MENNSPLRKSDPRPEVIPEKPYMLTSQGELFQFQVVMPKMDHYTGGKKNMVFHFSRQSRLNLLKLIAALDWDALGQPLFITLTYPNECLPLDAYEVNLQRWRFQRYVEQYLGETVPSLWRIEWKPRLSGAKKNYLYPHLHLLSFTPKYLPHGDVREWWQKSIRTSLYVRTDVQRAIKGTNGGFYVAKYASKDSSSLVHAAYLSSAFPGRSWGIMRKELLVYKSRLQVRLAPKDIPWDELGTVTDKMGNDRPFQNASFTLFGTVAIRVAKHLMADVLDDGFGSH